MSLGNPKHISYATVSKKIVLISSSISGDLLCLVSMEDQLNGLLSPSPSHLGWPAPLQPQQSRSFPSLCWGCASSILDITDSQAVSPHLCVSLVVRSLRHMVLYSSVSPVLEDRGFQIGYLLSGKGKSRELEPKKTQFESWHLLFCNWDWMLFLDPRGLKILIYEFFFIIEVAFVAGVEGGKHRDCCINCAGKE